MIYIHNIDPILLSIGFIDLYWYGAMYAISFLLLDYLMKKEVYLGNSDFTIAFIDKILLISILLYLNSFSLKEVYGTIFLILCESSVSKREYLNE